MFGHFLLVTVLVALLASCGPASSQPSAASSASPSAPAAAVCAPIDLKTPSGTRVDLTGTWRAIQSVHYVRQVGNCVWWVALSDVSGHELGDQIMVMFRGDLGLDFTLHGEWMSLVRPAFISDPRRGLVTFDIQIEATSGSETLVLHSTSSVGPYQDATLDYVGPLPNPAPL